MKVDGREIVNSNISDLISDAVRARKNFNPTGTREFFRGLARLNVPKDIAGMPRGGRFRNPLFAGHLSCRHLRWGHLKAGNTITISSYRVV